MINSSCKKKKENRCTIYRLQIKRSSWEIDIINTAGVEEFPAYVILLTSGFKNKFIFGLSTVLSNDIIYSTGTFLGKSKQVRYNPIEETLIYSKT